MQLTEESKERLIKVFNVGKTVTHYGWIPFILWLGYTQSSPKPQLMRVINPLA
ncbi:mitochondrial TOM complex subunit Tom7 [Schizosaccharomyces osmophilus]|uniref:TOM complex subunit Tom7 n=3 Tax=Schizosaccharomyces TaxID=4895 RepID=S9VMT3_SCHCR|nr:TOM complex subunit Tom7 [Schizosaccharomyces octosporus yFS286]XP_013025896.1 TOM complex subunit Tom7 [Schizosaccharomyces cryophilus OY26]XP_056037223.1 mitochondrial TOM complex subunit Tom7 [Schizosaccharomyces osmophilus]EPX74161.1 TOM complex subunit Tom7 [Schizosaccharomyces octosporus yFS286]EPY49283.1 TOM complex subunit Tom7 [Schizosaccharomyces cryophilus OY26]WBW72980.1 mitochondrial TOM complex subunit Tom7 [Schizosaccharomyces osmophilus]